LNSLVLYAQTKCVFSVQKGIDVVFFGLAYILETKNTKARHSVEDLQQMLEEACGYDIEDTSEGDTITFECSGFQLDFTLSSRYFVVKDIKVAEKRAGIGRSVMATIHEYCRLYRLIPIAENVIQTSEAIGFWRHLGYLPDPTGSRDFHHARFMAHVA
jgi:hypothetical protein